jgi:hypothetical protein
MTTRFTRLKKFAGLAVMATVVTAVGLGLGSGTAQAKTKLPNPPHPFTTTTNTFNQRVDNFFDGIQSVFGVGEGTPFDNRTDMRFGVN